MLKVDLYALRDDPFRDAIVGTITLDDAGNLAGTLLDPDYQRTVDSVLKDPIYVRGKVVYPNYNPELWIKNLWREYKSYAVRATEAVTT
jgi:hypothetical protein